MREFWADGQIFRLESQTFLSKDSGGTQYEADAFAKGKLCKAFSEFSQLKKVDILYCSSSLLAVT